MSDRQVGILGLMFYATSLKGFSWYSMFALSVFIHVFRRCGCHKDIKQSKADHFQYALPRPSSPRTRALPMRDAKRNSQ